MSFDVRYLTLMESGRYLGRSTRWMRRHWPTLVREGVQAYRVPRNSKKGHLLFLREGLDRYIETCAVQPAKIGAQV